AARWFVQLKNILVIRRMEFFVVEVTIFGMPILAYSDPIPAHVTPILLEGGVIFFLLFSLGDIINCLADRELDVVHKTRLARAVSELGVENVRWIVILLAIVSATLALHLSLRTQDPTIFMLVAVGMFLGIQYSVGPIHFK